MKIYKFKISGIKNFLKESPPYIALIVTLIIIGYFAWSSHNRFEKAMINQAKKQLLITALSEAQSIGNSINDAAIPVTRINDLVKHINDLERAFAFIVREDGLIVDYPYAAYVGKNILAETKDKISSSDWLELNRIILKIHSKEEGTGALDFFSEAERPKIVRTLLAFAPLNIGVERYSVFVAMEYDVVAELINKSAIENLIFLAAMILALFAFGLIFYRIHREKDKLALSELTLNIINRQLHSEIDERKNMHNKR